MELHCQGKEKRGVVSRVGNGGGRQRAVGEHNPPVHYTCGNVFDQFKLKIVK